VIHAGQKPGLDCSRPGGGTLVQSILDGPTYPRYPPDVVTPTRDQLLAILRGARSELQRLGVRRLALFGSFARDEAGPDSDVDLLVELDRKTFDRYMDAKLFLEDLLDRHVDLVLADRVKPRLREALLRDAIDAA